jgi:hypothetical protein
MTLRLDDGVDQALVRTADAQRLVAEEHCHG